VREIPNLTKTKRNDKMSINQALQIQADSGRIIPKLQLTASLAGQKAVTAKSKRHCLSPSTHATASPREKPITSAPQKLPTMNNLQKEDKQDSNRKRNNRTTQTDPRHPAKMFATCTGDTAIGSRATAQALHKPEVH
jgi:hypothetical protein